MTTAKWTMNTEQPQELRYPAARFNEKGCLPVWAWRCSKYPTLKTRPLSQIDPKDRQILIHKHMYYFSPLILPMCIRP